MYILNQQSVKSQVMSHVWWPWPNLSTNGGDAILIVTSPFVRAGGGQWHYWYYAGSIATLPHGSLAIIIIYSGNPALHLPGGRGSQGNTEFLPKQFWSLNWANLTQRQRLMVTRSHGRASGGGVSSLTPGLAWGLVMVGDQERGSNCFVSINLKLILN